MGSQGQGSHSRKTRRVPLTSNQLRAGTGTTGGPTAGVYSVAKEVKPLQAGPARTGAGCGLQDCWAAPRPFEHRTDKPRELPALAHCSHDSQAQVPDASAHSKAIALSELHSCHDLEDECLDSRFAKGPRRSFTPYLTVINNLFKQEKLTKVEICLKEKTMAEMTDLNKRIKHAQIQQDQQLEDCRRIYHEKLLVQAENRLFLEYLTDKTEEYRKQPEKVWNSYLQKKEEIERRRQQSASKYAEQMSVLKTELLQKEKIQYSLKQKLQAMRDIAMLKEKQEKEIQTLQEEKKKVQAETEAKKREVQAQLLQEKRLLEKRLRDTGKRLLGKRKRRELNMKAQALELTAKQSLFEYACGIKRENQQSRKELLQLTEQSQKLTATESHLKNRKQQLQQERYYVESLIRVRQRLQGKHNQCLNRQDAPKATPSLPQATKSKINPE
uniref:DUF4515 domain-containing protein n=1 Tax=Aotus nancymaae TaxID=37293 RepID=A0A2K5D1L3_AOTNA|nr:coiled-coil domain-containing protein 121 [Aotus nancymaae]